MRIILMLVVAVAAMMVVAGCPKVKISSPISVGPSGPSQIGIYLDEQWNNPLEPAKVVVEERGFWKEVDWEATWQQSPVRGLTKQTFNVYIFPSSTLYDYTYTISKIGSSEEIGTYVGDADFGTDRDPKPTAKIEVTLPARGQFAIVQWAVSPGQPPEKVYLLEW